MADCIKIGNLDISAVKIGSTEPTIYVGGVKVYPTAPPSYKLQATYSDSSTYNIECDSSTTLTRNEVRSGSTPYSSMTTAVIGDCVTTLYRSFSGCKTLSSVTLPNTVTNISSDTFFICSSLISVDIPSGVTSIGSAAFEGCSGLTSIDIPNSVTTIGSQAFRHCSGLTSIEIPSSVTDIGLWGFESCSSLINITINATTPPTLGTNVFYNTNNCPIYVPCDSVDAYKAASGWSSYASRIQAIPGSCAPTLQWVEFNNGDTIDSTLDIYGISGNSMDLSNSLSNNQEPICFSLERATVYCYIGYPNTCYTNSYSTSDTVELTFSDIGCSDYYNLVNSTTVSSTIKLLIYQ